MSGRALFALQVLMLILMLGHSLDSPQPLPGRGSTQIHRVIMIVSGIPGRRHLACPSQAWGNGPLAGKEAVSVHIIDSCGPSAAESLPCCPAATGSSTTDSSATQLLSCGCGR